MKKLVFIAGYLLSTTVFAADVIILNHHFYQSPGVKKVELKTERTIRTLSQKEIDEENNNQMQKAFASTLKAVAHDAFSKVNQDVRINSDHSACFKNTSKILQQYGYHFELAVMSDYVEDAETFMMGPGQETCISQNIFMTSQPGAPGKYQITATTIGAEGSGGINTVKDYATLTVT